MNTPNLSAAGVEHAEEVEVPRAHDETSPAATATRLLRALGLAFDTTAPVADGGANTAAEVPPDPPS